MRRIDEKEVRFLLLRGLQSLSPSILADLRGSSERRQRGLKLAEDIMYERFATLTIDAPDPLVAHGDGAVFDAQRQ